MLLRLALLAMHALATLYAELFMLLLHAFFGVATVCVVHLHPAVGGGDRTGGLSLTPGGKHLAQLVGYHAPRMGGGSARQLSLLASGRLAFCFLLNAQGHAGLRVPSVGHAVVAAAQLGPVEHRPWLRP